LLKISHVLGTFTKIQQHMTKIKRNWESDSVKNKLIFEHNPVNINNLWFVVLDTQHTKDYKYPRRNYPLASAQNIIAI
jgi:hypothetical protein